jgi:peptide/nickel transport system substrate-binding protein
MKYFPDRLDTYRKTQKHEAIVAPMTRTTVQASFTVSMLAIIGILLPQFALSSPQHGLATYGNPALPKGFTALPYVNPDAPKGGTITLSESGSYDSLNPYILKGTAPYGIRTHVVESLMGRSYDESFSLYGLIAESVETDDTRSFVTFTLRKEARFSNGDPVTVEDVLWSFETLGTKGHPRYSFAWKKIAKAEKTGPRSVTFTFNQQDRELPLILGLRPILRKADWDDRPFEASSLDQITGSGPYTIGTFEPGRFISFTRNPDYWGKDLGLKAGHDNFDTIKYDYYIDRAVIFEAFKAGSVSIFKEGNAQRWLNAYGFPAMVDGRMVQSEIPHKRPSGMTGFVMNTRDPKFADIRVRDALIHAFNFEFINQTLNGGTLPRITSYFSNSVLSMQDGPAEGKVAAALAPYGDKLPADALQGYALPNSDGSRRNRKNLRKARKLLEDAGWSINNGVLQNKAGDPFTFEILLKNTETENEAIMNIYTDALARLGIQANISLIDDVQHRERMKNYDFEMAHYRRYMSLSPGNEQTLYWGSAGVTEPGTRNYMGMNSPAADGLVAQMLETRDTETFQATVRALDRVLTTGRYVVPIWHSDVSRIAHDSRLKYPKSIPTYGDWIGFLPDVWWYEE